MYGYELDDNQDSDAESYDSRASYSSEDFEKTFERRYYGDGLGHWWDERTMTFIMSFWIGSERTLMVI